MSSHKDINQKRGPTVGNSGTPSKRTSFIADKASKQSAATEIVNAIGARATQPNVPKTNYEKNQGQVSPNTNKGRGPTKGNK